MTTFIRQSGGFKRRRQRFFVPSAAGTVTGTLDATFDALTLSGAATVAVSASASASFDALTLSGSATVAVTSTLNASLDALTLSGAATVAVAGTASATFDALTLTGYGTVSVTATMSETLGALTSSADATVADGPSGSLSSTFDALTVSGAAEVTGTGTVVESGGGGGTTGGGSNRFYRGKYRLDIRRAIERAIKTLAAPRRKLKAKKLLEIAADLVAVADAVPVAVVAAGPELAELDKLRERILVLAKTVDTVEAQIKQRGEAAREADQRRVEHEREMQALFAAYLEADARIEEAEVEAVMDAVLAVEKQRRVELWKS